MAFVPQTGDIIKPNTGTLTAKAPMYVDGEIIKRTQVDYVDVTTGSHFFNIEFNIDSGVGAYDKLFELSSDIDSSRAFVFYNAGALAMEIKDSTNARIALFGVPVNLEEKLDVEVTIIDGEATMTCCGNSNSATLDAGVCSINRESISAGYTGGNTVIGLLYSYESSVSGKIDCIRNQDDGLAINSDTGKVFNITEDVVGSSQIKPDGTSSTAYEWPESEIIWYIANGDVIGYRDPTTGYFSGAPLAVPVTPAQTSDNDRYVGNDYVGSMIAIDTAVSDTILHLEEWEISFFVNNNATVSYTSVYGEGQASNTTFLYRIGTGDTDAKKIRIFLRNSSNVILLSAKSTADVFDGTNKHVTMKRTLAGDILLTIITFDETGIVSTVNETLATGLSGVFEKGDTSTIGALVNTGVQYDFSGSIWDFVKDGMIIPINEGTGTTIYNTSGAAVGTLTDGSGIYWDYSVKTWKLIKDVYCESRDFTYEFTGEFK